MIEDSESYRLRRLRVRRENRRAIDPGFPWTGSFASTEEARAYVLGDKIRCLLCGKWYKSLGWHINSLHGHSESEYKQRFGIPYGIGLCAEDTSNKHRVSAPKLTPEDAEKGRAIMQANGCTYRPPVKSVLNQRMDRIATVDSASPVILPCPGCGTAVQCSGSKAFGVGKFCPECLKSRHSFSVEQRDRMKEWEIENSERSREYSKAKNWWGWQKNPEPLLRYAEKWGAKLRILPKLLAERQRRATEENPNV